MIEKLLSSTVIVAVLAFLGSLVTTRIQEKSKQNEMALAAFRENQTAQTQIVTQAFGLIGAYMASIDDLISLTDPYFRPDSYSPGDRPALEKFFHETQNRHDQADVNWREKKYTVGYLLVYHHSGSGEVSRKWAALVKDVDAYDDCATGWFKEKGRGGAPGKPQPCGQNKSAVEAGMSGLTGALQADRGK
jgi:hypothetical protein